MKQRNTSRGKKEGFRGKSAEKRGPAKRGGGFDKRASSDKKRSYKKNDGSPGRGVKDSFRERSGERDSSTRSRSSEGEYGTRSRSFNKDSERDTKPFERRERSSEGEFKARSRPYTKSRTENGDKPFAKRERSTGGEFKSRPRTFNKERPEGGERPYAKRDRNVEGEFKTRSRGSDRAGSDRSERPFDKRERGEGRPTRARSFDKKTPSRDGDRPYKRRDENVQGEFKNRSRSERPSDRQGRDGEKEGFKPARRTFDKPSFGNRRPDERSGGFRERKSDERPERSFNKSEDRPWNRKEKHEFYGDRKKSATRPVTSEDGSVRLNKYIANAGICSRREADELIGAGVISVNGNIVTEMGFKVMPGDVVKYNNESLRSERLVYILLNKPKDFITTTDDPEDRKTVMSLIAKACKERVYPVGRLDRNTTGVLLFTNDGDLAKKLTHPSFQIHKVYQVELDRAVKGADLESIREGIKLEDGMIKADEIVYTTPDKDVVGIELHSGKNRIVRRIFEHLGYEVKKLDRVVFAGLTKKDLPRGRWRFLTDMEVASLKMMTGSKKAVSQE